MQWSFWMVGLVVCAGHAKLLADIENYLHGFRLPRATLQRIRGTHNLLLFGVPLWALIACAPRAFVPSPPWWTVLPTGWWVWIAWGMLGVVVLTASTVRHLTYQPPACLAGSSSKVVDIQSRVPESLVGDGRARKLARLPFNEQFTLEVNEKVFAFERLPAAWDGLSIVHFSDFHLRGPVTRRFFEEVVQEAAALNGDLIAFTGDLLDHKQCLSWIESTLGRLSAPLGCYFVLGNHDWYMPVLQEMRETLRRYGWIDLAGSAMELHRDGDRLLLAGTELPWMGAAPDLSMAAPDLFRILLSHSPDAIDWAQSNAIDLMLAGHTHGGQIRLPIIGPVYAPSRYSTRYASGIFRRSPTVMHVTRGISGREPIRYLCRPELTRIALQRAKG